MRMLVTRNGPSRKGMYEIGEVEHGGGVTPQTINTDVDLCQKLRALGLDEAKIDDVVNYLRHKDDFAKLEREPDGEWMVTSDNRKEG